MSERAPAKPRFWCCTRCGAIYRKDFPFCPNDGAEIVVATRDPLLGTALEHYQIDELLGEGASGRVYRAHHKHLLHKRYAVKVLLGEVAATQAMRLRFAQEAESASRLSHPNVISVVDFARTSNGLLYLVMELVDGVSLSALIDRGPMDPRRVARLARGVCDGLSHAHEHGLVHRDLKPENILVVTEPGGEVPRIVDFGLAISMERESVRLTTTGMAMGTPAYIAPEQLLDQVIDGRADQYALGVTMFEMLTGGVLPFNDDAVVAKTRRAAPLVDERLPAGVVVPPELSQLIARMMARNPDQRFDTMRDVSVALDRWLHPRTTESIRRVAPRRGRGWLLALAALGIVGGAAAGVWRRGMFSEPSEPSNLVASASPPPTVEAPRPLETPPTPPPPVVTPAVVPEAVVVPEAAMVPEAVVPEAVAVVPEIVAAAPPAPVAAPGRRRPSVRRVSTARSTTKEPRRLDKPAVAPKVIAVIVPPPPAPPVVIPPAPPVRLAANVVGVDVVGALSQTSVKRAIDRVAPSLRRCTSTGAPHAVEIRFAIGESRRAREVRGSGASTSTLACLVAALASVRTESAPDVGEASVVVHLAFRAVE